MKCLLGHHHAEIEGNAFQQVLDEIQSDCYDTASIAFEPGDVVVDIGAHIGLFSCYVALNYPQVRVVAYEPAVATYKQLIQNIAPYSQITAFRFALGDGKPAILKYNAASDYCSTICDDEQTTAFSHEIVKTLSLDEIIQPHDRIACLKIDCEGAEWKALLDSKLLDRRVENLRLELHHHPAVAHLREPLRRRLQNFAGRDYQRLRIHEVNTYSS